LKLENLQIGNVVSARFDLQTFTIESKNKIGQKVGGTKSATLNLK